MTNIIEEMDFSVKITRKRGITHVPRFISKESYFPSLDLEIDLLVQEKVYFMKMKQKKRSTSQERDVLHFFLFFFLKLNVFYILTLELTLRP